MHVFFSSSFFEKQIHSSTKKRCDVAFAVYCYLDQEGFDLESLEHFQGSVVSFSGFPWTAFSEKSSSDNQTE
jgi:hypothetical protein